MTAPDARVDTGMPPMPEAGVDAGPDAAFDADVPADATIEDAGVDSGPPDAGPIDFRDLRWGTPSALGSTADPSRCETDAIVTADMWWMFVSRPTDAGSDCYADRELHLLRWNGGAPVYVDRFGKFDPARDEHNYQPVDGSAAGRPGWLLLMFAVSTPSRGRDVYAGWISADPPATPTAETFAVDALNTGGNDSDPTTTVAGDRLIFGRADDLYESVGTPPVAWTAPMRIDAVSSGNVESDPALSADGRVLVFARRNMGGIPDLWVARRDEPGGVFGSPVPLPSGAGQINTSADELDPFITAEGDLLFTSNRGGTMRIYLARRVAP